MTDVITPEKRSWVMSRIRGKNTKIDLKMKKILSQQHYKFQMYPKMFGSPDFTIKRKKIAIFCDGDFWHGYNYDSKKKPAKKFWRDKIEGNMSRDKKVSRKLRSDGWSVLRFWEHDIEKNPQKCIRRIREKITKLG
ncbi:MAG: very short patch repair endonuclease [Thaumarchaeota archaeon]|nr:very short patch repair endonuclease [Nitrososphaerota archaeon]